MILRSKFDGQKILVPSELIGHEPCAVHIVPLSGESNAADRPPSSIWDVVARSRGTLTPQTILNSFGAERNAWENR
jgi:hypothetical protein